MNPERQSKLKGLLDAFEEKRACAERQAEERRAAHLLFLQRFDEKVETIVRPAMQEVAVELEAHGVRTTIEAGGRLVSGARDRSVIMLTVAVAREEPQRRGRRPLPPDYTVRALEETDQVIVHDSTLPEGTRVRGLFELDEISRELIEERLLSFLSRVL